MYIIRKKFKFEMAHQLHDAYSRCCKKTIHGHSYIMEVFFASQELDDTGMVVDFGEIKEIIGDYVNSWDHALVMPNTMDSDYLDILYKFNANLMVVPYNPTAEKMAEIMYWDIAKLIQPILEETQRKFQVWKVILHETDTGYAEFQPMQFEEKQWKEVLMDFNLGKI